MNTTQLPLLLRILRKLEFPHKLGLFDRFFAKKLATRGICTARTAFGLLWKLDFANPTHSWLIYGDYEGPALRRWAKKNLPSAPNLVVSGANIGQIIASLHPRLSFKHILAFEPNNEAADWLQFCLQLNTHIPARLVRAGLGEKKTTAKLAQTALQGSQSFISQDFGETIPITTLADEWSVKAGNIDLWVLDVEGYEIFALKGALPLLEKGVIKSIYIEADPSENSRQALSLLKNLRWQIYMLRDNGKTIPIKKHPEMHINLLALPPAEYH
jgi:FkbM family methyltransferase